MTGSVKHYFASGNTAAGFASLFDSSLQRLKRLYVLQGGPGTGKSSMIRSIGDRLTENGYDMWFIHCPFDNDSLDGVIVPALKAGIVNGEAPRVIRPRHSGEDIRFVDLDAACDQSRLLVHAPLIESLCSEISRAYERSYSGFAEALRIHDEWETFYIANMDFPAADQLTATYVKLLYGDRTLGKKSRIDHRFLGAATPNGAVDFVPNLTEGLKRYLVKGRAGSGKSTMLKKIAAAGSERGFDVETYHCGFDPNSLDMVIVRELGFAIFDSTAPHEYFPDRPTDEIIDMYEQCIKPGTDEAYAEPIGEIKGRYSAKMKESIGHLAHAKSLQDQLKQIYIPAVDFRIVDRIREEIEQEISDIAAKVN